MMHTSRPGLRAFAALALTVGLAACGAPSTTTQPVDTGAAPTTGTTGTAPATGTIQEPTTGAAQQPGTGVQEPTTGAQEPATGVQEPPGGVQEPTTGVQEPATGGGGGAVTTPAPTVAPTPEPEPSGLPTPRPTPTPEPTPDLVDEEDEPNDTPDDAATLEEGRIADGEIDGDDRDLWEFEADGNDMWITVTWDEDQNLAGDLVIFAEDGRELYRERVTAGRSEVPFQPEGFAPVAGETYYVGFDRVMYDGETDYRLEVRTED